MRKRISPAAALVLAAVILLAGGLALAAAKGNSSKAGEAVRAAEGRAAAQRASEKMGKAAGPAECDGDCQECQNQECVRNQGAESQLENGFQNCEGECDGDCLRTKERLKDGSCGGGNCPH